MSPRILNDDGEWVDAPAARPRRPDRPQSRLGGLTWLGWAFLIVALAALTLGGWAADQLGLAPGGERKLFRLLIGGGLFGLVLLSAVLCRAMGTKFYRDQQRGEPASVGA